MLRNLYIKNFIIIDELNLSFEDGLTIITGETGAGKSILIDAVNIIFGQKTTKNLLLDKEKKTILEISLQLTTNLKKKILNIISDNYEIEEDEIIIRREINPNGKTRSFLNDTPINKSLLKQLQNLLVDIHSQNSHLYIKNEEFRFFLIDSISNNQTILKEYQQKFKTRKEITQKLEKLNKSIKNNEIELLNFQLLELEEAKLNEINEQAELEKQIKLLDNIEEIKENLSASLQIIDNEELGVGSQLTEIENKIKKTAKFNEELEQISKRFLELTIEVKDISSDIERIYNKIDFTPEEAEKLKQRLDTINLLEHKHKVESIAELIEIKHELSEKVLSLTDQEAEKEKIEAELTAINRELTDLSDKISNKRKESANKVQKQILYILSKLGLDKAAFEVRVENAEELNLFGKDKIEFLFSADSNLQLLPLTIGASGGEVSRIMLGLKYIYSRKLALPTIIFDEIDIGVSGKIADKMGEIIKDLSKNLQTISITHLPQIASKAKQHLKVIKEEKNGQFMTKVKKLTNEEKINEIATMISGESITEAAKLQAKELLNY